MSKKKSIFENKWLWVSLGLILLLVLAGVSIIYKLKFSDTTGSNTGDETAGGSTSGLPPIQCVDADGKKYTMKAECSDINGTYHDSCVNDITLREYFCDASTCRYEDVTCEGSCSGGRCVSSPSPSQQDQQCKASCDAIDTFEYYLPKSNDDVCMNDSFTYCLDRGFGYVDGTYSDDGCCCWTCAEPGWDYCDWACHMISGSEQVHGFCGMYSYITGMCSGDYRGQNIQDAIYPQIEDIDWWCQLKTHQQNPNCCCLNYQLPT